MAQVCSFLQLLGYDDLAKRHPAAEMRGTAPMGPISITLRHLSMVGSLSPVRLQILHSEIDHGIFLRIHSLGQRARAGNAGHRVHLLRRHPVVRPATMASKHVNKESVSACDSSFFLRCEVLRSLFFQDVWAARSRGSDRILRSDTP